MRVTLKNLVGSPYDVPTLNGPAILPANGELAADFDPAMVDIWRSVPGIEVVDAVAPMTDAELHDAVNEELADNGTDLDALRELYREKTGQDADKRWGEKRLMKELGL